MRHHDLVVIGTGSGNMVVDERFDDLDVAIVERTAFGGTCLNVGCIPTKMFAYTAEVAHTARQAPEYGVDAAVERVRWSDIQERVFSRLDPISADGRRGREQSDNVTVYLGQAEFTGPLALRVRRDDGGTDEISADRVVIADGARPSVPPPVESARVHYETSDSILRIDALPRRLAILGGGYIAAEYAHIFGGLGCAVTIIDVADALLASMDETISQRFTEVARERFDVHTGQGVDAVEQAGDGVRLRLDDGSTIEADMLLVAAGRVPNGDRMNLGAAGIDTHDDGRIAVDGYLRTSADGVFALGDVSSPVQLKHAANHEATVAAHNLLHPDAMREVDLGLVPAAVFTSPQIGTVGCTEQQCRDEGRDHVVAVRPYSDVAYGWAMEDETGFCKLIADPHTSLLLGAHLMGPQAPTLVQSLVQAMALGVPVTRLADVQYWIHPALSEVVENALRALDLEQ
ncbi:mycothione reductase [Pseudonocardia sp. KRD291]|uniref:mycothione reductase n=1 Tax=Pseudonocardia sp. KRD291 TaxID=2792007 RepID=UPI001C4A6696|nr:mycothione reductase [Pseudonocardia sp. KRD291]MBW0102809.1 mycothione reductase [Pseudonocardia sp. KRD291]